MPRRRGNAPGPAGPTKEARHGKRTPVLARRCTAPVVRGSHPVPAVGDVFTLLDLQTKAFFDGKRTDRISSDLPPGRVVEQDRWVRSMPIQVPGHDRRLFIAGRLDAALAFDDGTFGIVDYKVTAPKPHHASLYGRQLRAYATAAENPAPGNLLLTPVTRLGLMCFEPTAMTATKGGAAYRGTTRWVEIPRDDDAFMSFMADVADLLDRPTPPDASPSCAFCSYLLDGVLMYLAPAVQQASMHRSKPPRRRPPGSAHLTLVPPERPDQDGDR
jgi:hypothetical protein